MRERINYLDSVAGISIVLVVFGHLFFPEIFQSCWYVPLRNFIYKFHMELFMFVSGFIVFYSYKPVLNGKDYFLYIKKKVIKFVPAYFIFGILYLLVDINTKHLSTDRILFLWKSLFLFPIKGSATFIWYIYVLFVYYLLTPWIVRLPIWLRLIVSLLSFGISFLPWPMYFSIDLVIKYLFFFLSGSFAAENPTHFTLFIKKWGIVFAIAFLCIIWFSIFQSIDFPYQLVGIISIPAFFYFGLQPVFENSRWLHYLGRHSYFIYLFNSLWIGIFYLIGKHLNLYSRVNFAWCIPLLVVAGIAGSLIAEKYLRKIPMVNRYM